MRGTVDQRLWAKIHNAGPDDCWLWEGATTDEGYGSLHVNGRMRRAHVLVLEWVTGEPANGRWGLHFCDVKLCCSPMHLRWGSPAENVADVIARGGRGVSRRILTAVCVREIRARYAAGGISMSQLSGEYGVRRSHISEIVHRHKWRTA